jgi:hypothetical protein
MVEIAGDLPEIFHQSGPFQPLELPLYREKGFAGEAFQLALVEFLLGVKEEELKKGHHAGRGKERPGGMAVLPY